MAPNPKDLIMLGVYVDRPCTVHIDDNVMSTCSHTLGCRNVYRMSDPEILMCPLALFGSSRRTRFRMMWDSRSVK